MPASPDAERGTGLILWIFCPRNGGRNVDVGMPDRDAGKCVGQEIAQRPAGPRAQRAEIEIRHATAAGDGHRVSVAAGRRQARDRRIRCDEREIGLVVIGLDAQHEPFELRVVAGKAAEAGGAVIGLTEHRPTGRLLLVLQRQFAQRISERRLRGVAEIAAGAAVADLTADIDAGPAVDVHGRIAGLRARQPAQIVREGAWRERKRQQCIYDATHRTPFPLVAGNLRARTLKGG